MHALAHLAFCPFPRALVRAVLCTLLLVAALAGRANAQIGACCRTDGTCTIETPPTNCPTFGGAVYLGNNTTCQPGACPALGACCFANGSCSIRAQSVCLASSGSTWRGPWTTCSGRTCFTSVRCRFAIAPLPNSCTSGSGSVDLGPGSLCADCTGTTGACCAPSGTCSNATASACTSQGGIYLGANSVCFAGNQQCPPRGACCLADGSCSFQAQIDCTAPGSFWGGPGVTCDNASAPCAGACCNISPTCLVTLRATCLADGGTWSGPGVTCTAANCPTVAACCAGGTCTVIPTAQCAGISFTTACTPTLCAGACCLPDGSCQIRNFGDCPGGWLGLGSTCSSNPCPSPVGACCTQAGTCILLRQNLCTLPGEVWLGAQTTCNADPCRLAACCTSTGGCSVTRRDQCDIPFQSFWLGNIGGSTTCSPNTCTAQVGACCAFQSNTCTLQLGVWCSGGGQQYRGGGTTCSPINFCLGACCLPNGSGVADCMQTAQQSCFGVFRGYGTSCADANCLGACCTPNSTGSVCTLTRRSACPTNFTGGWKGPDTTCFVGTPDNLVACCRANFNRVAGVTVQDIFDFLAAWFGNCTAPGSPPCLASADFNASGTLTVQDLFDFLAAFFAGCT